MVIPMHLVRLRSEYLHVRQINNNEEKLSPHIPYSLVDGGAAVARQRVVQVSNKVVPVVGVERHEGPPHDDKLDLSC